MKKNYVSPLATEVTLETTQMLAVSPLGISEVEVDTENDQLAGDRRDVWGNVWKYKRTIM